jgi:methionine-rich copper-binding protein CopC
VQSAGSVAIVEMGATPDATGTQNDLALWAQLENRGPAFENTRVVFSVVARDGHPTWSAWYDNVPWLQGERKRLEVEWDIAGVTAGSYRLQVTVTSEDQATVYSTAVDAGLVRVGL